MKRISLAIIVAATLSAPLDKVWCTEFQYTFDLSSGLFSVNRQLLEDITGMEAVAAGDGWFVADGGARGSFTYDNAGPFVQTTGLGDSLYAANSNMAVDLIVNGNSLGSLSAVRGGVIVRDNEQGDLVNASITNASEGWSGEISIGQYSIIGAGVIWTGGDFISDQSLPGMLPPPPGYEFAIVNFGIVDAALPSTIQGISAAQLVLAGIPAADVTGTADISGDAVPDVAHLTQNGQPKVRYYSGASRQKIKGVSYFGPAWVGVAITTVADGDANGVADDPAVAVLAHKRSDGKNAVEVRRADNKAFINKVFFLGPNWTIIDVAVIDVTDTTTGLVSPALAVLGVNPNKPFEEQIKVQVRWLNSGALLANWYFLNGNWTPLALEGVNRSGATPLLAVLANKAATGANVVQARQLSDGVIQRNTSFFNANWLARDVAILLDSDGDGNANDPAYLVLANDPETGRNKVQTRRVSDGSRLQNVAMLGTNWNGQRITGTGDISGNLREEVGVLGEKTSDGRVAIQLKDYADRTTTATIFP